MTHRDFSRLNSAIDLRARQCKREVDQFERESDFPVIVANNLNRLFRDMLATKDSERSMHIHISYRMHDALWFGVGSSGGEPLSEMVTGNGVLLLEINGESLAREERIEDTSIVYVFLAVEKDPTDES
jgi:hypothetical protein